MVISVTENAARQIQNQLAKRGKGVGLRVGVKKVGCSGLAYTFEYADEMRPGDSLFEAHDAKVVVDADTLSILDGSRLWRHPVRLEAYLGGLPAHGARGEDHRVGRATGVPPESTSLKS